MTVCSQFPFDYIYSGKNDIMPTLVQAKPKPCIVFKKLKMKILDGCQPSQKCILHSNETWVILMIHLFCPLVCLFCSIRTVWDWSCLHVNQDLFLTSREFMTWEFMVTGNHAVNQQSCNALSQTFHIEDWLCKTMRKAIFDVHPNKNNPLPLS